jgi:UDPglucose 6-dehydrogenase
MKITVIGTGYVGLVTGTCLAETGNRVICMDVDAKKVASMKKGIVPIYEPGLEILLKRNIKQNRLFFTTELKKAVKSADIIFLALPTPQGGDGAADLSYVLNVSKEIVKLIDHYTIVINKSTVPVGTAELVKNILAEKLEDNMFDVVSNPEFLREGKAVEDFLKPDRVVIGSGSEKAIKVLKKLYKPFLSDHSPLLVMDERSAELTKYAANSFLALKISFMNEIANLSEKLDTNVDLIRKGIGADERIGNLFLFPGVGYGGSCFPKDVQALNNTAEVSAYDFKILKAVIEVNALQRLHFTNKIIEYFGGDLSGKKIAVWGLSFKPDTDDIREAPSFDIIKKLIEAGASVSAFDPEAIENFKSLVGDEIQYARDQYDALKNADALCIITEWTLFRAPNFSKMKSLMAKPVIFDGRNIFDYEMMKKSGFYYNSVGRKTIQSKNK